MSTEHEKLLKQIQEKESAYERLQGVLSELNNQMVTGFECNSVEELETLLNSTLEKIDKLSIKEKECLDKAMALYNASK